MIVAVDGPAGAGKSTACRLLAKRLGFTYLDTGAMYRALAWVTMQEADLVDEKALTPEYLERLPVVFTLFDGALCISFHGRKLEDELRHPGVAEQASRLSQLENVRTHLTRLQRSLAGCGSVVAEGRDTTSVVFPEAPVRIYLTADLRTRAERRRREYLQKGVVKALEDIEQQIRARDKADEERAIAPLRSVPGVLRLDTSHMTVDEVVERLVEIVARSAPANDKES